MSTFKLTSTSRLIRSIQSKFKIEGTGWLADVYDWIGEAIQEIGTVVPLRATQRELTVNNYKLKLPCSIELLRGVEYENCLLKCKDYPVPDDILRAYLDYHQTEFYFHALNYLQFTFQEGSVIVYYKSIPIDKEGFPEIIDDPVILEAIRWKIITNILAGGYQHPVFSYYDAEQRWIARRDEATNKLLMPNPDELELVLSSWISVKPNFNTQFFLK